MKAVKNFYSFFVEYRIFDWIVTLAIIVVGLALKFSSLPSDFEERFTTDIEQERHTDTISYWIIFIGEFAIVPFFIFLVSAFMVPHLSKNKLLIAYFFAIGANMALSGGLKRIVGRPRPDTKTICGGDGTFQRCKEVLSGRDLSDQFFSFPSGHTSESTAALFFLSLFLSDVWPENSLLTLILRLLPIALQFFIAATRIWDRKHHVDDVVAGMFYGAVISGLVYSVYKQKPKGQLHQAA